MQVDQSRQSESSALARNIFKTIGQTVFTWGVFLWLVPLLIIRIEMVASIPNFADGTWSGFGLLLFMASCTLFLLSAGNIIWHGRGTPWPWDHATHFVVAGPYRYMRNPMVIATIGLGLSTSFILGSYLILLYVIFGFVVWNFVLRPLEEADLSDRFGQPYLDYAHTANAYVPKTTPYRALVIKSEEIVD